MFTRTAAKRSTERTRPTAPVVAWEQAGGAGMAGALLPPTAGDDSASAGRAGAAPEGTPATGWAPESYALLSALVPGAGQAAQGRRVTAGLQAAAVASYLAGALAAGGGRAFWLALGWNAWSALDAYRHARD